MLNDKNKNKRKDQKTNNLSQFGLTCQTHSLVHMTKITS
jgi:hypothetical protein